MSCYIKKYTTEARDSNGVKIIGYVASCAKHSFQTVKPSKTARDKAADKHELEHKPRR